MAPDNQRIIQEAVERYGNDNLIVVLGAVDPEALHIAAETVRDGDPAFVGPLAGVQLGLHVVHIFDEALKAIVDPAVYQAQVGPVEMTTDIETVFAAMDAYR